MCVCAVCFPRVNLQFFRRCEASERENERERLIEHWQGRNRMRKKTEERGHSTISNFTSLPHDFFLLGTKVGRKIELPRRSQSALQLVGALRTKNLGSKSQRVAYKAEKFLFLFIFILKFFLFRLVCTTNSRSSAVDSSRSRMFFLPRLFSSRQQSPGICLLPRRTFFFFSVLLISHGGTNDDEETCRVISFDEPGQQYKNVKRLGTSHMM